MCCQAILYLVHIFTYVVSGDAFFTLPQSSRYLAVACMFVERYCMYNTVCTCTCTYGPPPESRSPLKKVNEASIHPFIPASFPQYIPQTLLRSRPIRLHSLRTCSFSNPRCAILPIDNSQTFSYIRILPLSPPPPPTQPNPPETQIELLSNRLVRLRATSSVSIRPV